MPSLKTPTLSSVGAILLAAGESARLGQPKQLLQWQGKTLLRRAAETALAAVNGGPAVVVLGAGADNLISELAGLPVTIVLNDSWQEGMASSLRAGIAALHATSVEAALVLLCDQPLVTPETLDRLMEAFERQQTPAVVSAYPNGTPGPPCLFARSLFPSLLTLEGAQGAKQLLRRLPVDEVFRVPFSAGAVDIDTPEDWARFESPIPGP